jgi:hypothetical protein
LLGIEQPIEKQKPLPFSIPGFIPRQKSPAAGSKQKAKVVPASSVIEGIDGHIIPKEAGNKANGRNKSVKQAVKETILASGQTGLNGLYSGTGCKQEAKRSEDDQKDGLLHWKEI